MFRRSLLALTLALTIACGDDPEPEPASGSEPRRAPQQQRAPDSPALQFLPRLNEARGWTMEGDPQVIPAERLEGFLGHAAGIPQTYGALDASVGRYSSTGGRWATVTIFRYPDFVKAFGAYSATVPSHAKTVGIGNRGAAVPNNLTFWSGPYVVSITGGADPLSGASQASAATPPAPDPNPPDGAGDAPAEPEESAEYREGFGALANTVAERMPRAESLPAVFRFLPQRNMIEGSERFSAAPLFGQPALAGAFTAKFRSMGPPPPAPGTPAAIPRAGNPRQGDEQIITAAIIPTPDKQTAARVLASYRSFFARNGRLLDPVPNLGEENFIGEDKLAGRSVAFRLDRFVVVFNGYGEILEIRDLAIESAQRILNEIRQQLEALEEQEAELNEAQARGASRSRATRPQPQRSASPAATSTAPPTDSAAPPTSTQSPAPTSTQPPSPTSTQSPAQRPAPTSTQPLP